MKTKLLRKVRKRFEVYYCDNPPYMSVIYRMLFKVNNGNPFYFVSDNKKGSTNVFSDYDSALEHVLETVKSEYGVLVNKKTPMWDKVWYCEPSIRKRINRI